MSEVPKAVGMEMDAKSKTGVINVEELCRFIEDLNNTLRQCNPKERQL